ncbi:DUF3380 domain-containing protein [Neorhizobium galegae]|nr:DUF3380 domain-containing protein [Neorhizobium galegae]
MTAKHEAAEALMPGWRRRIFVMPALAVFRRRNKKNMGSVRDELPFLAPGFGSAPLGVLPVTEPVVGFADIEAIADRDAWPYGAGRNLHGNVVISIKREWRRENPPGLRLRTGEQGDHDEAAALKATSWGLTQILGENCKAAGYPTPQAMVLAFMADEENHLEATVSLLKHMGIADDLKAHAWAVVARVWNGPGYRKNKYDTKMAAAYAKWAKVKDTPFETGARAPAIVAAGKTDRTTVRVVQERLKELGYTEVGNPDGKMGKLTKTAILAFRNENDLPVSDIIDDGLLQALDGASPRNLPRNDAEPATVRQAVPEVQSNFLTKIGAGGLAGGLGVGSLGDLASKADSVRSWINPWKEMFSDIPGWAWLGGAALVLVAIAMIARRGELKGIEAFQAGERR